MRPAMKRKTERKMGMCNAVSTAARDGGSPDPDPNMGAYLCGAPCCLATSEKGRCSCGAIAAERTVTRTRTKLKIQSTLVLVADAKGLNGGFP